MAVVGGIQEGPAFSFFVYLGNTWIHVSSPVCLAGWQASDCFMAVCLLWQNL